jgi:uncharacterized protein (DUF1330 family)
MSHYFMACIHITDEDEYRKYLERAREVFARYDGTYLAVDDSPKLLEGEWDPGRVVLISFESEEDFNTWYRSAEYQEILQYRLRGSKSKAILVRGWEDND